MAQVMRSSADRIRARRHGEISELSDRVDAAARGVDAGARRRETAVDQPGATRGHPEVGRRS